MKTVTLEIQADMLLDAITHAVFISGPDSDDYSNGERMEIFKEVAIQLAPAIDEPLQFGAVIEAFCKHENGIIPQTKPSKFVRWTRTSSEEQPWIAGDGEKHSWSDFRRVRLVK